MSEQPRNTRYQIAKIEADKTEEQIIAALREGYSFRVEAGAGSGKTYSLNKVVEWLQTNKQKELQRKQQQVICITFTNAAVNVIKERLIDETFIVPSTIHSFAWEVISPYQRIMLALLEKEPNFDAKAKDSTEAIQVLYTLGHRYRENGIQYLHHNDVLKLFVQMLEYPKFRRVFASKHPIILIDEYQDSYKPIVDQFLTHFIDKKCGPQFGFFGDSWQTIYQSNNACGKVESPQLKLIRKKSNFRSAPVIVEVLNRLRPDLPQLSAIDGFEGEVVVVTCDDYRGNRQTGYYKGELPVDELRNRLQGLSTHVKRSLREKETFKTLMITHSMLAKQQGYENLHKIIKDGFSNRDDPFLLFFMNVVEPICHGLSSSNVQVICDALVSGVPPITKKAHKLRWKELESCLSLREKKTCIEVLRDIVNSELIPIPPLVSEYYQLYQSAPETPYGKASLGAFLGLQYSQFLAAIRFLYPDAEYSTEHGVKGDEFDHVIFTISRGWNDYQFEKYAPMILKGCSGILDKQKDFERNRNLFYVCCSRAKKRLIIFISLEIDSTFRQFLSELVGVNNIYTYSEFLGR